MNVTLGVFIEHLRNPNYSIDEAERARIATLVEVLDFEYMRAMEALHRIALMTGYRVPDGDLVLGLPQHVAFMIAGENQ
ncbi:hypothetical protein AWB80_02863 [Caballeronia pedi]|uniref:Uncharacterized protein n=1 Tax=Caballeronia pedi TaxID=1777141 RepID=A0A158B0I6_9BURK|nr:hypothetical protein [Caballeronia pedi]SAK63420.1 hypothetical protein AWB80_02863 [Caballeronia pedi]